MKDADLKALAAKATPGEWREFILGNDKKANREKLDEFIVLVAATAPGHQVRSNTKGGSYPSYDLRYIAAANPQAIIALLERIERLRAGIRKVMNQPEDGQIDDTRTLGLMDKLLPQILAADDAAQEATK